jgi:UDP-N-acetylglucosamine transferase subunit ALG13
MPGIALYTQHSRWGCARWRFVGSVFDGFQLGAPAVGGREIRRVVVTLGTMEHYGFRRLIERVYAVVPTHADVLWQVGCTNVTGMPIDGHRHLPQAVMKHAIDMADVVIAHAGCGSAIAALKAGKRPVLVPRLKAYGENVDDHQVLLGRELAARGLALVRSAEDVSLADLREAARSTIELKSELPHLRLVDPTRAQSTLT